MYQVVTIPTLLLLLISSCSSLHERADRHFKDGDFLTAARIYEEIVTTNPKDALATERLNRVRQKLIEEQLILVRQKRLSNDFDGALKLLANILSESEKWKVSPSGAAFSTQAEEFQELFGYLDRSVAGYLMNGYYLKAQITLKEYENLFSRTSLSNRFLALEKSVIGKGQAHCRSLLNLVSGKFSNEFAMNYCTYWGVDRSPASTQSSSIGRYGAVRIVGNIRGVPSELLGDLQDHILSGLKQTPFYQPNEKVLRVSVYGAFDYSYNEKPTLKTHSYEVQVPYQVQVSIPQLVTVPQTTYSTYCNSYGCYQQPNTSYTYKTEYHETTITKYRTEARSEQYLATEYKVTYTIVGKAVSKIDGVSFDFPMNEQFSKTDFFHSTSNPEIGLYPKERGLVEPFDWLKGVFASIEVRTRDSTIAAWEKLYCSHGTSGGGGRSKW